MSPQGRFDRWPIADFEAEIRIYSAEEGGRRTPARNGIQWDFAYEGDDIHVTGLFMIWPEFLTDSGESFSLDLALPIGKPIRARMSIVNTELRQTLHRTRLAPGVRFYCHEGGRRVAEGRVTKLGDLFQDRNDSVRS
jgi:translation elongation factor EF-Tu-like GTPase